MTKITYIPGEIANAAIDEHGNRKPVTRTHHIFDDAKGKSQAEVNADIDDTLALHQSEINALNSQNYVTVDSFNALPDTGEADTVYRVSNWDGTQQDPTVYSEYAWNGSQYVHLSTKTQIGEVFDISAYHATGGELAKYADLAAALDSNNGGGVPQSLRKGGMSVKFVQSYDNKYVQYRYMGTATTGSPNPFLDVSNWQGVDDEPTAGSKNLVESGGVYGAIDAVNSKIDGKVYDAIISNPGQNIIPSPSLMVGKSYRLVVKNNGDAFSDAFYIVARNSENDNIGTSIVSKPNGLSANEVIEVATWECPENFYKFFPFSNGGSGWDISFEVYDDSVSISRRLTAVEEEVAQIEGEINEIDEGAFDVTKRTNTQYENLTAALTAALAIIPADKRRGGMSIKFAIQKYTVAVSTQATVPTGTLLSENPNIGSGSYIADELSVFPTLPTSSDITYYISNGAATPTYIKFVISKNSANDCDYVEHRLILSYIPNTGQFIKPENWQGVERNAKLGNTHKKQLVEADYIYQQLGKLFDIDKTYNNYIPAGNERNIIYQVSGNYGNSFNVEIINNTGQQLNCRYYYNSTQYYTRTITTGTNTVVTENFDAPITMIYFYFNANVTLNGRLKVRILSNVAKAIDDTKKELTELSANIDAKIAETIKDETGTISNLQKDIYSDAFYESVCPLNRDSTSKLYFSKEDTSLVVKGNVDYRVFYSIVQVSKGDKIHIVTTTTKAGAPVFNIGTSSSATPSVGVAVTNIVELSATQLIDTYYEVLTDGYLYICAYYNYLYNGNNALTLMAYKLVKETDDGPQYAIVNRTLTDLNPSYTLSSETILMKVNPGDVVELGGKDGSGGSGRTRYCILKSLPDYYNTQKGGVSLTGCFPTGVSERLIVVSAYEKRVVEQDGHYLLVQNSYQSGLNAVGYLFINGLDVLNDSINDNKKDTLYDLYDVQNVVGHKKSFTCNLTVGEDFIGIITFPISSGHKLKISIVDAGNILSSSASTQSLSVVSSAFTTINSGTPFDDKLVTATNDSRAIYLKISSNVIASSGSISVNLENVSSLSISKFGKITKPIITVIDDDTPNLNGVALFRDACNAKGIKGTFASLTNTWRMLYTFTCSGTVGTIVNGTEYNYTDCNGVTRTWRFMYSTRESGQPVKVTFEADEINAQFPPSYSGTFTKTVSSGDATIDTITYTSYEVEQNMADVLKSYTREGHQTVVHAYAQRDYFMTQKKIVFTVDSNHPLSELPNGNSQYTYTSGSYTGTMTCYGVETNEGVTTVTFSWVGNNVSHEPSASGTIAKASGPGDSTVYYSSFVVGRFLDVEKVEDNMVHAMHDFDNRGFTNYNYWVTPYGSYGDEFTAIAKRCGLQCIVSIGSIEHITKNDSRGRYNMPRYGLDKLGESLSRIKQAIDSASENVEWIIVGTHFGTDAWTQQQVEDVFYEFVDYAKSKGMTFVTLGEGLASWNPVFTYWEIFDN